MEIKLLSIIVPIYKQEKTIKTDLLNIYEVLSKTPYPFEIIGIIDGINIDNSYHEAKSINNPTIKIYAYKDNKGKGLAVRYGMEKSKGNVVAFIDAGMDIHPDGIMMLLEHMRWYNADIIIGSKLHAASKVDYTIKRKLLTLGYYFLVKCLFGHKLKTRDTQTGIKAFKRNVLNKTLDKLAVKQFAFDIEILMAAYMSGFQKIYDAPVKVTFGVAKTTINPNFVFNMILDTLAVWYRTNILNYYDEDRKREKIYDEELDLWINTGNVPEAGRQVIINIVNKITSRILKRP